LGLGIAYAGKAREDISELLQKLVVSDHLPVEQSAFAALSLGLVLVERSEAHLNSHWAKLFGVALGLLFMGQQSKCDAVLESLGMIEHPIKKYYEIIVESMAYTGSGNVLKVQKMANEFAS
jgi:26S proteasome regulatory subunit N1